MANSLIDPPVETNYNFYEDAQQSSPPQGDVAKNRATRYHIALGDSSPGVEALDGAIQTGQESYIQTQAVSAEQNRLKDNREKQIKQAIVTSQTPEQAREAAQRFLQPVAIDPNVVLEQSFADRYIGMVVGNTQGTEVVQNAAKDAPEETKQIVSNTNHIVAMKEIARKIKEDQEAENAKSSWGEYAWNLAETMVPAASATRMSPDWNPANIIAPGSSLRAERQKFWSFTNLSDAQTWLKSRVSSIAQSNPLDAAAYASAMLELPTDHVLSMNTFGVADAQGVGSVAAGVTKAALSVAGFRRLMKSAADAVTDGTVRMENVQAATGDIKTASRTRAVREIVAGRDPLNKHTDLAEVVPNFYNPSPSMTLNPGDLAREAADRIVNIRRDQNSQLLDAISKGARAQRVPEEAIMPMVRANEELVKKQFPSVQDSVIDTRVFYDSEINTRYSETIIGKKDGTLFRSANQADNYAQREYGLDFESFSAGKDPTLRSTVTQPRDFTKGEIKAFQKSLTPSEDKKDLFGAHVKQQGTQYYISIVKPLNETGEAARSMLLTTSNQNPVSVGNWLLGMVRSAEDQLAKFQRDNRHMALHVPQEVQRIMVEVAKPIRSLKKDSREALQRVLDVNKDYMDYSKPEGQQRGRAFKSQQALEKNWLEVNKVLPNEAESLAYWTYHDLMDTDWVMRNYGVLRDLTRQGLEHYTVKVPGLKDDIVTSFPGRFEKDLPWDSKNDFSVLVLNGDERKVLWRSKMTPEQKDDIDAMIKNGRQVLQVGNPVDRPFKETMQIGHTVNFVLTKDHKVTPLPIKQVDYQPGVHVMYPQEHFVKQPIIEPGQFGVRHYYGDRTIFAVDTEKEAERLSKAMNDLQNMMRNQADPADMQKFIEKNLPEDLEWWAKQFQQYLSMDQPIGNTYSGKNFFDTRPDLLTKKEYSGLRNERNTEWNLYRAVDMDFMQDRDAPLNTVTRKSQNPEKPLYALEQARTMDPYVAMNRTLGNSIRNLYMNDAKISAIEQWTAQYAKYMQNPEAALKNPFQTFYHPSFNEGIVDRAGLSSAHNTRERIINFLGTRTELGRDLNHIQQKLMNSVGEGGARWYNDHELKFLKNPVAFLRSWMFDFRFGFFNPKQYIVQAQGFTHIYGVAGVDAAWRGTSAYILQRALGMTEDAATINRVAGIATKFGWKKADFLESYKTMRETGFDIVGKEHSLRDEAFDPKLFTSRVGNALEWGRTPFVEGERSVRIGAWNTAYYEWKTANPNKALNEFEKAKILTRADDLSLNMTKASHSSLQEGLWSVPTQFYTFSHRIMEQFWGGRLTGPEKARAFLTHSMLYGVPVAAGAMVPWPFYDSLRGHLLAEGNPVVDERWFKLATDGFMNHAITMISGTEYNAGTRYGPGFNDSIRRVLTGEMPLIEGVAGASGSFLNAMYKATYPFQANIYMGLTGQQERFPLAKEDFLGVVREISSVNDAYNAYFAVNAGKFMSKAENWVAGDMTAKDAVAIIAGLTRRDIADARIMMGTLKEQQQAQIHAQNLATTQMKLAFQYADDKDWTKFDTYMARAKAILIIGDLRDEQIAQTYQRATSENQALVNRISKDFTERGYKSQLRGRLQRMFDQQ